IVACLAPPGPYRRSVFQTNATLRRGVAMTTSSSLGHTCCGISRFWPELRDGSMCSFARTRVACPIKSSMESSAVNQTSTLSARAVAESVYRSESRRVFVTLVRLLGDFDIAEEALHDAFH